jgi:Magnesium chelatase, subunit ChlI
MLARRLTTILPALTLAEAIETTCIHSVAGLTGERTADWDFPPTRRRAGDTGLCRFHVAEAEIKRVAEGSLGGKDSNAMNGGGRGHCEETEMWHTWKTLPPWRHHAMRVMLVAVVLFVSACTTPGRTSSSPSALFLEGGYTGLPVQGIKDSS